MDWFQSYWWALLVGVLLVPVAAAALFARWLQSMTTVGYEDKVKSWDVFVKLVSAFTVVASGAVLIGKYFDQREQVGKQQEQRSQQESNLRTAEFLRQKLAFDTEWHQRRLRLFDEAKLIATRLANSSSPAALDLRRFEELYGADLIGVEQLGGPVEAAMVRFRRKLRNEVRAPDDQIDQLALQLANACETELRASKENLLNQHEAISALVSTGGAKQ